MTQSLMLHAADLCHILRHQAVVPEVLLRDTPRSLSDCMAQQPLPNLPIPGYRVHEGYAIFLYSSILFSRSPYCYLLW